VCVGVCVWGEGLKRALARPTPAADKGSRLRKYQPDFLKYGFSCTTKNSVDYPQCVICSEVLAHKSLKPVKLKEQDLKMQKTVVSDYTTVPAKALAASYEVAYLVAQSKKAHTIAESLIRPAAVAMTRAMHGEKNI